MRKYLFSMLAMAAVLFTACTQEEDFRGNGNGDEVTVAFSVKMPTATTRAYNPGECIDELVCVVFENVNGEDKERYCDTISGNNNFTFTPQLINGRTYDIVFWAQNTGAYDVTNAKAIKRNAGNFTEAEYDAFTYVVKNFQVTEENLAGNNVTLGRPFAQLNIGVTDNDLEKVKDLGYIPTNVVLTVDNAATEFNALTGKQVNADEEVSYTLPVPGEKIAVAGVDYNLLSQCFVLLEEGWPNANVTYEIRTDDEVITSGTINNVPFDANYKTNIVGTLMTEKPSFNITINAAFATPDKVVVENAAAANAAFAAGETNVKINEITADAELVLTNTDAPVSIELPATDKTVSVIYSSESGAATPEVVNVIVPDGKNVAKVIVNAPESTVNIEGDVENITVYSAENTAYIKAGANVGTVTVGKGNVVIEAGAEVDEVVRADGNGDDFTLITLGEGVERPALGEKIYVVESFNVLTFAKFKTALADAEYEWDGKGAIVLLLESERNYQNNKTAQFFVGASNVNITDPVEKVKVSNVTFQFEDDATDNAYTSGELQVFAKTIGFTGCTFIGTAVSPWGKSNTENAETAEFVDCTWKNLSGRYGVHQNRASNLKVQDCTFENCERGIHTNSTTPAAITITGNTFTGIGDGYGAICLAENGNIGEAELNISGNTAEGQVFLRQLNKGVTLEQIAAIKKNNTYGTLYVSGSIEVVPVAKIGDVEYKSLAEAVAAVKDGGTITLIANETFTKNNRYDNGGWWDGLGYSGDKSFTIDLGGFTVSQNGALNDYLMWFKNVGSKANTITIKNGTLDAGTTAFCALCTASSHENQLTINTENLTLINNKSDGSTVKVRAGSILNVKGGTKITGKNSYLGIENWNATVNIYDGAEIYMNGTSSYNGCLVGVGGNGTVNVYGGYGKGVKGGFIAMTSGGTINVAGGEWIANTDGTVGNNSNLYVLTAQNNKYESGYKGASIINVTGGTFRGGMDAWVLNDATVEKAELNISGGNFNADPTSYVAEDYIAVENNGVWTIELAAAKIGDVAYATLDEAVQAAKEGDKIVLLKDDELLFPNRNPYEPAKNVFASEIDLNGNTLTIKEGDIRFNNTTIKNGNIVVQPGTYSGTAIFLMYSKNLTLDGVNVTATGVASTYLIDLEGTSNLNLLNGSEILVDNTTAIDTDIICSNNGATENNIVIENSKVTVNNIDGRVFFSGNYTVKDSEISLAGISKAGFRINADQTLDIEGESKVYIEGELRDGGIHLVDAKTSKYNKAETATVEINKK